MSDQQMREFYRGYVEGYRAAVVDMEKGKLLSDMDDDLGNCPIRIMGLSTRALNCLSRAGCQNVREVAKLKSEDIAQMRSLGVKTAAEIAHWLQGLGVRFTAWEEYLQERKSM